MVALVAAFPRINSTARPRAREKNEEPGKSSFNASRSRNNAGRWQLPSLRIARPVERHLRGGRDLRDVVARNAAIPPPRPLLDFHPRAETPACGEGPLRC